MVVGNYMEWMLKQIRTCVIDRAMALIANKELAKASDT